MKKTLLLLLAIVMATTSFAQVQSKSITPTGNEMWWGYFGESDASASNYSGYGVNGRATYEAAIRIPKNDVIMGNATIKGMRLWFKESTIIKIVSLKIWATSTALKSNAEGVDYVQDVDVSTLKAGANDIAFSVPYAIVNTKNNNIGYTITLNSQDNAVMCGGEWEENSFWFRADPGATTWSQKKTNGKLALQLLAEGVNVPDNSAITTDFGIHYFEIGKEALVPIEITNKGKNTITSIAYTITTNNDPSTTTHEVTVPINNLTFNSTTSFDVPMPTDVAVRDTKTITITKVNGEINGASADEISASGQVCVMQYVFTKMPVIEEITSTSCGWCPVGFDALENLSEKYGEKVAFIAIHRNFQYSDPMQVADYNEITSESYPNSYFNRGGEDVYPSESNLDNLITNDFEDVPYGMVELSARWNDEEMTSIDFETNTKFALKMTNANYGVALVLTNDGLKGSSATWSQANYLSHYPGYESFTFWYNAPSSVTGVVFNHVAVAAWNIKNGFDGSVKTSFEAGESMKFNYTADISKKTVIQDKSKLKAIALLIDRSTGHIINAAHTTIKPMGVEEYYMVGSFNDWHTTEEGGRLAFVATDEAGIYEATGTLEAGAEFKLITPDGDGWKWLGGVDENNVGFFLIYDNLLNVPLSLVDGSNFRMENGGEFTFRLNTNDMTLTLLPVGNPVIPGDVNGDGEVTGSDVTALYNHILFGQDTDIFNGDQNGDGEVTGSDVTAVYNIILGL